MTIKSMRVLSGALVLVMAGCTVGPDYRRPEAVSPPVFKEDLHWKSAAPRDEVPRGPWWQVFGDAQLDELASQVAGANQTVQQALAQYRQAMAATAGARAGYYPTADATVSSQRSRSAGSKAGVGNTHGLSLQAGWEPDLWGKVARSVESDTAAAQASAATLAATRLSAEAELVQDYLQLRVMDALIQSQTRTVEAYQRSLVLTQNQFSAGQVSKADVALAQSQLQTAKATLIDYGIQRSQYEHAIAILIGRAPAQFSLPADNTVAKAPSIPVGVPSDLLERRPDIAAAERRVAAANAQIGVARAVGYPVVSLSGSAGLSSALLAPWLSLPSRVWALGGSAAQSIFDGGAKTAKVDQAMAAYDATVADYRQTVLTALQEVEDDLVALRLLADEIEEQSKALDAAREAERITLNQYRAGQISYGEVVSAQNTSNSAERASLQLQSRRHVYSVALIKALGGGWQGLPTP